MKRLIIVASLAILAVGCQKTFVENEVQNTIGFNTEVGKQTRAIAGASYLTGQPFGVFSYGHENNAAVASSYPMSNVVARWDEDNSYFKPDGTYYWPNSAETTLNFYAYSPYGFAEDYDFVHAEGTGFIFEGYIHQDTKLDFMTATPVVGATFNDQNGEATDKDPKDASVPFVFNHMMTQVVFNVKTDKAYAATPDDKVDGITFTVNSITLNDIYNQADFSELAQTPWSGYDKVDFTDNDVDDAGVYNIDFTAKAVTNNVVLTTEGVTMIPQTLEEENQSFTINYTIEGKGVATETVSKTVDLKVSNFAAWAPNMKVTYNVKLGLNNQITFTASVGGWDETSNPDAITILQ